MFGNSSISRSSLALIASSCCFLKPSVTGATMKGSRMALKIFLFPSLVTKWQLTLRHAWTNAPSTNQGSDKQESQNKKREGHKKEVNKKQRTCRCSIIKNYVADLRGELNEQLEKERILLPTSSPRNIASHKLSVSRYKIEGDIINGNIDTNRIKLCHKLNGEGGGRHLWIVLHQ